MLEKSSKQGRRGYKWMRRERWCVGQLSITLTKHRDNQLNKRNSLLWLTVLEDLFSPRLFSLVSIESVMKHHTMARVCSRGNCSPHGWVQKRERKRPASHNSPQGHSPPQWPKPSQLGSTL
jgi:hypothetical protein